MKNNKNELVNNYEFILINTNEFEKYKYEYQFQIFDEEHDYLSLIEKNTNNVILVIHDIFLPSTFKLEEINNAFCYYLKLLPKLDIKTISYMFTLLGSNLDCNKNIFKFNKNYPSEFGKLCLKETYGQIIYQSQLIDLIYNSDIYYNISKIYGLIKIINKKSVDNYYQFENLVLPDGYKLFDLLTEFTPLYKNSSYPGLLLRDQYKEAYYFLKSSKKFI